MGLASRQKRGAPFHIWSGLVLFGFRGGPAGEVKRMVGYGGKPNSPEPPRFGLAVPECE
jgi:hypothetical protein